MAYQPMPVYTLAEIAQHIQADVVGDDHIKITNIADIQSAGTGEITFLGDRRFEKYFATTKASAIVLKKENLTQKERPSASFLLVENPLLSFARIATLFFSPPSAPQGIDSQATIHPSCDIGENVSIGAGVHIAERARIGKYCEIAPNCTIGPYTELGSHCRLEGNVVLADHVQLGKNVLVHAGAVVGFDGFGLTLDEKNQWTKIPQCGCVMIGNDCEIGCNVTIARGAFKDTVLERDVHIDSLVHIAHNVVIGEHTVIAGATAIAGSTKIGKYCQIGGASRISDHLEITDYVSLAAASYITHSINTPGRYNKYNILFLINQKYRNLHRKLMNLKKEKRDS